MTRKKKLSADKKFTCDRCGETFISKWSDEDAMAEYNENWGKYMGEDLATLCDVCHEEFMTWFKFSGKEGTHN